MVRKWGPSLRTMLYFAQEFRCSGLTVAQQKRERAAFNTARKVYGDLSHLSGSCLTNLSEMSNNFSPLLFIRPASATNLQEWGYFVPTEHIQAILHAARMDASNEQVIQLFEALSKRRISVMFDRDWELEIRTHMRLSTGSDSLHIFNSQCTRDVQPSTRLLPGMLKDLKGIDSVHAGPFKPFYWIPAVVEFHGIDAVFGDDVGNIYALQMTVGGERINPVDGLSKLWKSVNDNVRERRKWHFVVVTDSRATADELNEHYSSGLQFGSSRKHADVWAAIL